MDRVTAIVRRYTFPVDRVHEKMDSVQNKIHNITCHLPIDQLCYNQEYFSDLADIEQSNQFKTNSSYFCEIFIY